MSVATHSRLELGVPAVRSGAPSPTILVTGASSGVGRAIARSLAGPTTRLCLVGRRAEALAETAAGLPGEVMPWPADLTAPEERQRLVSAILDAFDGRLDVLVHSAGIYHRAPVATAPVEMLDRLVATNATAPFALLQGLLPALVAAQGQVVLISSTQALSASPTVSQYAASHAALAAIGDSFRGEVNPLGVRVLTVHLGRTATPMQERIYAEEGREYRPERLVQPEDVAAIVQACLALPPTAEVTSLTIRPRQKP